MLKYIKKIICRFSGNKYNCPVCKSTVNVFNPIGWDYLSLLDKNEFIHSIFQFETLNIINYSCPVCGASDRDRLSAIYLTQVFKNIDKTKQYKFVDFAPASSLSKFIKSHKYIKYRSADLFMEGVDDKVDLMDMKIYQDDSIDMFICSHILEHVDNDRKAMNELYRILKVGGCGIVMIPILLNLNEDYEDTTIISESDRWKYFGQNDHVRIYSKNGFVNKLEEAGFQVNQFGISYFGKEVFEKHAIHNRSVLYSVGKN